MAKVAFLGLGVMGYPMAGHLLKKGGHEVTVYNRSAAKAQAWAKEYGGKSAATPKEAAQGCEFVMMCVGNDDDVRSVAYGDAGALAGLKKGAILVDHTTASAVVARELHGKCKAQGAGFVDAPVSGGQAGAVNGQLGIMCGGEQADFDKAKPVLDVYAKMRALPISISGFAPKPGGCAMARPRSSKEGPRSRAMETASMVAGKPVASVTQTAALSRTK
jgi:3-hydroxyisobutyrate dehydrogenase-like beta-hydroxyacid dehydrogenase